MGRKFALRVACFPMMCYTLPEVARKHKLPTGISVLSLRLPSDMHDRLREVAERRHRTVSQEIRLALSEHVVAAESEDAAA